jgi:hypothetical protein
MLKIWPHELSLKVFAPVLFFFSKSRLTWILVFLEVMFHFFLIAFTNFSLSFVLKYLIMAYLCMDFFGSILVIMYPIYYILSAP